MDKRGRPKAGRKTGVTVFLDPEDVQFLKDRGRKTGQSLSTLIRHAVREYIGREREESITTG